LLSIQNAIHVDTGSEPEPDLALLRPRADDYTESHPTSADILLIVEVSDSSLDYDRQVKGNQYAEAGIEDYWIMNLVDEQIEIHREPAPDGYRSARIAKSGDTIQPVAFPDVTLAVADILS
jgi:Uma2 family endonuclease